MEQKAPRNRIDHLWQACLKSSTWSSGAALEATGKRDMALDRVDGELTLYHEGLWYSCQKLT